MKFLVEEKLIDERQIWCYANMKARIKIQTEPIKIYGMPLVCVNHDELFLYDNAYNTPEVSFSYGDESFELEMDDWKRFATIFEA